MPEITVTARMSRGEARRLLSSVPAIVAGRLPDPTGAVREMQLAVGMAILSNIKRAFVVKAAGGTDEAGDSWLPLSQNTIDGRRVGNGVGIPQILRDTGILLNSLSPGAPGNLLDALPGMVSIGTNVKYAAYQHHGTDTIPARRLWPEPHRWPSAWLEDINETVRDGVAKLIAGLLGGAR